MYLTDDLFFGSAAYCCELDTSHRSRVIIVINGARSDRNTLFSPDRSIDVVVLTCSQGQRGYQKGAD